MGFNSLLTNHFDDNTAWLSDTPESLTYVAVVTSVGATDIELMALREVLVVNEFDGDDNLYIDWLGTYCAARHAGCGVKSLLMQCKLSEELTTALFQHYASGSVEHTAVLFQQ